MKTLPIEISKERFFKIRYVLVNVGQSLAPLIMAHSHAEGSIRLIVYNFIRKSSFSAYLMKPGGFREEWGKMIKFDCLLLSTNENQRKISSQCM